MAKPLDVAFVAGSSGAWRVDRIIPIRGEGLPGVERLEILKVRMLAATHHANWILRGVTSNTRYTTRHEVNELVSKQAGLPGLRQPGRYSFPYANVGLVGFGARRAESDLREQSQHIAIGTEYLPGVARRLHHSRELGESFDFLTWFEFAPEHMDAFDHMLERLRQTPEWRYVDREVDIRLSR